MGVSSSDVRRTPIEYGRQPRNRKNETNVWDPEGLPRRVIWELADPGWQILHVPLKGSVVRAMILSRVILLFLTLAFGLLGGCGEKQESAVVQLDLAATIRDLGSDDLDVSSPAEDRLTAIGDPAVPSLAAALRQEPEAVRIGVIEVLDRIGGEAVVPPLVGAVADQSAQVRADAVFALRAHDGACVEEAVLRGLRDQNERVRQYAAKACGVVCRSPDAVRALAGRAVEDAASEVGWSAVVALYLLRANQNESALAGIVDAAVSDSAPAHLGDRHATVRLNAAMALALVGDERAAPVLEAAIVTLRDPRERLRAIYGLGLVGGPSAVPVLHGLLGEPAVAPYAYDALRRAAGRGVVGADAALATYAGPVPPSLPPPP